MSVYIIAEAGVNHNGSLENAKLLVDRAKDAGADCIKFQTFVANKMASKHAEKAGYQRKQSGAAESQLDMLSKLELSFGAFVELNKYCELKGIEFLSTGFDFDSIDFLSSLNMKRWKIPSGEITNLPYLIRIAQLNKPVILSTGMSTMQEIRDAVRVLKEHGASEITILHCTTEYPAPFKDVNLAAMKTIHKEFNLSIGYSDHTRGIEISIAAVAMGATIIEKHFTLDRSMDGPDHQASLEPDELKAMVRAIRNVEMSIGSDEKQPVESEKKNIAVARKSIVANRSITKGEIYTEENLAVKRPGNGISPMKWYEVIGQPAKRNFEEDELIEV
ncbi:N-acetylneuraminate synthase [Alkalihalobacillus oceani]|uniref:N-acetylneuraminate synthase n=1 Tax=Halalkalibacter oceani TaxID=1653776 RepID=UPI00203E68F5|nr:N-acetylneuraminate synthase [Halalkalibacter oceani]MCM3760900.1 N-acetylneuraminate synthase [Halalkalibacter oceani]